MRELTFSGFLRKYVCELSEQKTMSLYKLAKEASVNTPRLREPLFLYALFSDKTDVLLNATKDKRLHAEYSDLLNYFDKAHLLVALKEQNSRLDSGYLKVWKSYVSEKNRLSTDNQTKLLMRNKIVRLQNEKQVTNYRLYTDLELNPGNLNAYLKHGDSSKLSLDTSRKVLNYLEMR
jgi:hypothetical protein